ncbi:pyocin knob domain-containing S74 family peptidase [Ulvibacterium sp.]|uniref:pyocin knob domain-containing S74 family peptidase n=1 Tax=Ulvibacterium sp. TaxID=2665914 RepID=UPI003BADB9C0
MKRNNVTLKTYFETGDYPTEAQFIDLIDSFLNIEEKDAVTGITDNGDGTYTFSLLSGGSITLNGADLPNDIPIANIAGLQAALDARDPSNFLSKDQDETTNGSISIVPDPATAQKFFSVARDAVSGPSIQTSAYVSLNDGASAIFGNSSSSDGQDSHIIIRRNGELEFNDNGSTHIVWHSGNDNGLFPSAAPELAGGQDLNTYQTAGFYYQSTNADAASGFNYPPDLRAGSLIVQRSAGVTQQYYTYNDGSPEIWFRALYTGSWSPWRKVWHDSNFDPNGLLKTVGTSGKGFDNVYLQWSGDGSSNNDYIAFNDSTNAFYFNADTTRQNTSANASVYVANLFLSNANRRLHGGANHSLRITTPSGYVDIGSQNGGFGHIVTDRPTFYFNKGIQVDSGLVRSYDEDLMLSRSGSSQDRLRITTGHCISDQNFLIYGRSAQVLSIRASSNNANTACYARFEKQDGSDRGYIGYGSSSNSNLYLVNQEGTDCFLLLKTNGEAEFNNNVRADNFILSSDRRLKEDIRPLNDTIEVEYKEFKLKGREGKRYGVIAQELEKEAPHLVETDDQTGFKAVKYTDLLIAKMAEKDRQINRLEKRLGKLEVMLEKLTQSQMGSRSTFEPDCI